MRYLDPKSDLTFKKIFGQHPHLLKSFLNALLPLPAGSYIESLEYLPAELVPELPLLKQSIVDVRCKDNNGRQFIVEMQMHWTTAFMQRVLFNASKAYVMQLDKPYYYTSLQPVYALSLVNDVYEPGNPEYYHHYQIVNIADTEKQIEGLEFVFVELPKFKAQSISEKKLQVLWLRFLTEIDEKTIDVPEDLLESSEIKEALETLLASGFSKAELASYDKYWDSVGVEMTLQTGFYDKGLEEGIAKGLAEGELRKACQTALKAMAKNMAQDDIAELTDLPSGILSKLFVLSEKYGKDALKHLNEIL